MKGLNGFLLSLALCGLIILLGLEVSTQWIAALLHYPAQFGPAWLFVGGMPVYPPKFFIWWYWYGVYAPRLFDRAALATYGGVILGVGAVIGVGTRRDRNAKTATTHGSARWAERLDIKKAGLLEGKGVVLGLNDNGHYLRHDGPEHVMVMAPTRSGKGVGIIIPTLLTWPHSVLVTDIKGENWGITAGFRQQRLGNKVLKFDPTASDGSSVRFNPLDEIRLRTVNEVRDVQNIADMLVDPQGTGQLDHWSKTGHALLVGVVLHLKYTLPQATLADVAKFLSNPERSFMESLGEMMNTIHDRENTFQKIYRVNDVTHPVVAEAARELLNKSENERSGVLSTAMSFLGLYRDPVVAANTAVSDFAIADLMNHTRPVSLYLVVPPSDINRTRPLIRMLLNQVVRRLTEKLEFKMGRQTRDYQYRLLLLLDEFPALGRLDAFETALAYIAGYGLKALLIIQSLNQLTKTYSQSNSIVDNCHIRVVFTPNDDKTPEFISKLLGTKTEIVETKSFQGGRLNLWLPRMSTAVQHTARPLLTPGEVSQLPEDREIIFVAGRPPIWGRKVKYYNDRNFQVRLLEAPPKSDVIVTNLDNDYHAILQSLSHETAAAAQPVGNGGDTEFFDDCQHDYIHGHDQTDPNYGHNHPEPEQIAEPNGRQDCGTGSANPDSQGSVTEDVWNFEIM
jgi:type IV secretion system protein VirD4